jgi:CrcB protein
VREPAQREAPTVIDPDLDAGRSAFAVATRSRWPRLHPDVVAVVFAGGCVGGYARYALARAWTPPPYGFPWATLTVNLVGAFVLALVVVAGEARPSRYLRPLLGTGFCGALTTFSSVVVTTAQLTAHDRAPTATGYLAASVVGGLGAAAAGLVLARALAGRHTRQAHQEGGA